MSTAFATATTVDEALAALAGGARPVAGGTDLVVGARQGKAPLPESLVAIHRVAELHGVEDVDGGLRLGPLATHAEVVAHRSVRERFTALADASAIVGSHATRAHGTIGGNLMNASPAMETGGPLMCLDATVSLRSATGTRAVAVGDLFAGPGSTVAASDELLVSVDVPPPAPGTGSAYVRLEYRRQMEIAVVGATAVVALDGGDRDRCTSGDHRPRADDSTRARGRGRAAGHDGRGGCGDGGGSSGSGRVLPHLGRACLRALPQGDGGGDRAARHRRRARTRARGGCSSACEREPRVKVAATLRVNGVTYPVELEPGTSLLAAVRDDVGLTGSKEGCDDSECGACMMLLDGKPVNSCSYLALQAEGSEVTTVEGLANGQELSPLQSAFLEHGGVQCGFCTPGMLISATALLAESPSPTGDEVRIALSGNLCRCTGYDGIVKAVLAVAGSR